MPPSKPIFFISRDRSGRRRIDLTDFGQGWFYADRAIKNPDFEAKHPRNEDGEFAEKGGSPGDGISRAEGAAMGSDKGERIPQNAIDGRGPVDWGWEKFPSKHRDWERRVNSLSERLGLDGDGNGPSGQAGEIVEVNGAPLSDQDVLILSMYHEKEFQYAILAAGNGSHLIAGRRVSDEEARESGTMGSVEAVFGPDYSDVLHTHPNGDERASEIDCYSAKIHWASGGIGPYRIATFSEDEDGEARVSVYRTVADVEARLAEIKRLGNKPG
jgi:hypothetical protein